MTKELPSVLSLLLGPLSLLIDRRKRRENKEGREMGLETGGVPLHLWPRTKPTINKPVNKKVKWQ